MKLSPRLHHLIQGKINEEDIQSIPSTEGSLINPVPDPSRLSYLSSLIVEAGDTEIEVIRPLRFTTIDLKDHLESFKSQLDTISTVDEALDEIDANPYHEKRDV